MEIGRGASSGQPSAASLGPYKTAAMSTCFSNRKSTQQQPSFSNQRELRKKEKKKKNSVIAG
jgi:hypothetical protein